MSLAARGSISAVSDQRVRPFRCQKLAEVQVTTSGGHMQGSVPIPVRGVHQVLVLRLTLLQKALDGLKGYVPAQCETTLGNSLL